MAYQETSGHRAGTSAHLPDWLNLALAVWLFISPWVLNFGGVVTGAGIPGSTVAMVPAWNAWILGVIVFLIALSAVRQHRSTPEWVNVLLGAWIIIAPWILGFSGLPTAAWDHWATGAAITILGIWGVSLVRR